MLCCSWSITFPSRTPTCSFKQLTYHYFDWRKERRSRCVPSALFSTVPWSSQNHHAAAQTRTQFPCLMHPTRAANVTTSILPSSPLTCTTHLHISTLDCSNLLSNSDKCSSRLPSLLKHPPWLLTALSVNTPEDCHILSARLRLALPTSQGSPSVTFPPSLVCATWASCSSWTAGSSPHAFPSTQKAPYHHWCPPIPQISAQPSCLQQNTPPGSLLQALPNAPGTHHRALI